MLKKYILTFLTIFCLLVSGIIFILKKDNVDDILIESDYVTILNNSMYTFKSMCITDDCVIKYKSLNEDIFRVNSEGDIIANNIGVSDLIVSSKNIQKNVTIEVVENETMITGIDILSEEIKLDINDRYLLQMRLLPFGTVANDLMWKSSDSNVVTVNDGYINALAEGEATITVSVPDTELTDNVKIIVGKGATKDVTSIMVDKEVITMGINETYQISTIVLPINGKDKDLIYSVNDENIVSVNQNGTIKSKAKGSTIVDIFSKNGVSTSIKVIVENNDKDLVIDDEKIFLAKGETYQLKSDYVSGIEWYSSNNRVATVSKSGLVKAISNGETVISVINEYGKINTVNLIVQGKGIFIEEILIDQSELSLRPGSNYKINVSIKPNNATNKDLIWETSDNRIAMVSDDGIISALKPGVATITVYSNNLVQDSVRVNVNSNAINIDSIEISPDDLIILKGDSLKLTTHIIPSNANVDKIIWESSNEDIVTVNSNGLITAHKTGNAIISAITSGVSDSINVEVNNNLIDITSITLDKESIELYEGETYKLSVNYVPNNATNKSFIWKSNSDNVSVSNNGLITALTDGTSIVTVESVNGIKDIVNVTVKKKTENQQNNNTTGNNRPSYEETTRKKVEEVFLNVENLNLNVGQTKQLKATLFPLNAENSSFTWVSSNENVVSVSSSGIVTAKQAGAAQVSVITSNGKVARANVKVTYPPIYDSGEKLLELYSSTLIVTMTKEEKSGIKKIRVWAADPYKQFHKVDATNAPAELVTDMINSEITKKNLTNSILIGGNAMTSINRRRTGNIMITEGVNWHYAPGGPNGVDEAKHSLLYVGIAANGNFNIYCTRPENNCNFGKTTYEKEEPLFQTMLSDGVRNTIELPGVFLTVYNGKKVDVSWWDSDYAIRHTMCQINTNNFLITISSNGDSVRQHQAIQLNYGCINGVNFDAGGSTNLVYKNKGDTTVSAIKTTTRPRTGAYYFAEY